MRGHAGGDFKTYVELYELEAELESGVEGWQEKGRWMKYEETAVGLDNHWGRPHVPCLHTASVRAVKDALETGLVLLDSKAGDWGELEEELRVAMVRQLACTDSEAATTAQCLVQRHRTIDDTSQDPGSVFKKFSMAVMAKQSTAVAPDPSARKRKKTAPPTPVTLSTLAEGDEEGEDGPAKEPPKETSGDHSKARRGSAFATAIKVLKMREDDAESGGEVEKLVREYTASALLKKIPEGSDAIQVYSGVVRGLTSVRFGMVRLEEGREMRELLAAPIPVKFLFFLLGPPGVQDLDYHQTGRVIATLAANPLFQLKESMYLAESREEVVAGLEGFMGSSILIPPLDIDFDDLLSVHDVRRELRNRAVRKQLNEHVSRPSSVTSKKRTVSTESQKNGSADGKGPLDRQASELSDGPGMGIRKPKRGDPLKRTGTPFGGMVKDLKFRLPLYLSDFKDAANLQCLTATIFIFFAAFAPAITFGDLMDKMTEHDMGIPETLIATAIGGIVWGLFSAQPLMVMSATGPVLLFEGGLKELTNGLGFDFMTVRWWAGLWVLLICLTTVAFEGSGLIAYFTPFTEDIFAFLISLIFIIQGGKFVYKVFKCNPVQSEYVNASLCVNSLYSGDSQWCKSFEKTVPCAKPNTAMITLLLFVMTFVIAVVLRSLKSSTYLGRPIRRALGDFGVLIAIVIVALFSNLIFSANGAELHYLPTAKSFGYFPTRANLSGFFVPPMENANAGVGWWLKIFFALVPALLVFILLFVETEITELLLAKKDRGLRKGTGYHWDLILIGVLTFVSSVLGLPWMCAAAVQSLAHGDALTVMKKAAPGAKPQVERVIEQRLTTTLVALLVGLCAFLGPVLKLLPQAAMFGVFLYLGVMNLAPIDFVHRLILFFVPRKYFPDIPYCRQVSFWRLHLFTAVQLGCLAFVFAVKKAPYVSMGFPFALLLVALFRLFALPRIFDKQELQALDGHEAHDDDEFDYVMF